VRQSSYRPPPMPRRRSGNAKNARGLRFCALLDGGVPEVRFERTAGYSRQSLPGGVCATVGPRTPPLPPGYDEPDWAAKSHMVVAPVRYHNYALGHLFATG
jgi:hypothetical protein